MMLALAGGGISAMKMAGPLPPPFSLFLARRKRENGPCTVQKRKRRIAPAGGAKDGGRARGASSGYACLLPAAWCGRGFWWLTNGLSPLFAAANLVYDERKRPKGLRPPAFCYAETWLPPLRPGLPPDNQSARMFFGYFLSRKYHFAALAARMASVSSGVTLKRSPQMP